MWEPQQLVAGINSLWVIRVSQLSPTALTRPNGLVMAQVDIKHAAFILNNTIYDPQK